MPKRIDEETQRQVIELYRDPRQELSQDKVAKQLRIDQTTVSRILIRNNEPRRSPGWPEKYPKKDFSGDPAELAKILGFIEDCSARHHRRQIRVGTGTTHPAQISLFEDLFGGYGHVSKTPEYNSRNSRYQWHLETLLKDTSFEFIIEYKQEPNRFLTEIADNGYEYFRIASLTDTEGHVGIDVNNGHPRTMLSISNNNRELLEFTQRTLGGGIGRDRDGYQPRLYRGKAVEALRRLPITHREKAAVKALVLHHADSGGIGIEALRAYEELRRRTNAEVRLCTEQARLDFISRHGKPHKNDPDHAIPHNILNGLALRRTARS